MIKRDLEGVCPSQMSYRIDDEGLVRDVSFLGGCEGNLKAIATLIEGRSAQEVSEILLGVTCGRKQTSCSDQLARALKEDLGSIE